VNFDDLLVSQDADSHKESSPCFGTLTEEEFSNDTADRGQKPGLELHVIFNKGAVMDVRLGTRYSPVLIALG
jgi:hypothetical protein